MDTLTFEQQNQRDLQLLSELSVHQANVIRQLYADSAELDNLKRRIVAVQQGIQQRNQIAQAPDSRALEITRAFTNGGEPPFPHGFRGPHGLRECLPQMYQDHELEMGDGLDIPATQVYVDGQSSQGLLPQLYQSRGLEMSDGSAHHEHQAHIDGHLGQGFAPQISPGFNFGNGSTFHGQKVVFPSHVSQAVPLQMYPSFGSFDIQSGQGLLPQTYPSSGLEMSDDSSFHEQQAAFDGQSGQGLLPPTHQISGLSMSDDMMSDDSGFHEQQAAFAGHFGHTPTDGQDTNNTPPKPTFKVGQFLTNCNSIVYNGANWVELRCCICHTNATCRKSFYQKGCPGLWAHFRNAHPNVVRHIGDDQSLIYYCTHRVVPQDEVDDINANVKKVDKVSPPRAPRKPKSSTPK